ncbi:MAG: acyltransferase [Planctomycetota bacterium]
MTSSRPNSAVNADIEHLNALTGLRFVAAALVFLHHLDVSTGLGSTGYPLGAYAVGFFFVLSGFILTYVYAERLKRYGVRRFYFSRWSRIWPLHCVCLVATLLLFPQYMRGLSETSGEWIRLGINFLLLHSLVPQSSFAFCFNAVSWSISTELFFYLLFPLLIAGGERRFWKKYVCVLVLTAVAAFSLQWLAESNATGQAIGFQRLTQTNPLFRLVEFATGIATGFLFLRYRSKNKGKPKRTVWRFSCETLVETLVIALVIVLPILGRYGNVFNSISSLPTEHEVLANWYIFSGGMPVFAVVILVFAISRGLWSELLGTRLMVFLGEISFAFYMTHHIVLRVIRRWDWVGSTVSPIAIGCCAFAISIGLSVLLFKVVEIPSRNALLKWYDGSCGEARGVMGAATLKFVSSRFVLISLLCIVVPVTVLVNSHRTPVFSDVMQEVIQQTPVPYRSVTFENGLRMRGLRVIPARNGIDIEIVWQRTTGHEVGRRFLGMLDVDGEMVRNGPAIDGEYYNRQNLGEPFLETISVSRRVLDDGEILAMGFRGDGRRIVRRDVGPRAFNQMLQLIPPAELRRLRDSYSR